MSKLIKDKISINNIIGCTPLGIFDSNNNEISEGCVIKHNNNLFLIRFSKNQKQWVARASEGMNWRDFNWIKNVSKYCEIVANIHFDKWVWERWQHCL